MNLNQDTHNTTGEAASHANPEKTKYLKLTMPDGSIWKLSLDALRVQYLVRLIGIKSVQALRTAIEERPEIKNDEEFIALVRSHFQWHEIRNLAICIQPAAPSDYESGWQYSPIEIIEDD